MSKALRSMPGTPNIQDMLAIIISKGPILLILGVQFPKKRVSQNNSTTELGWMIWLL